MTNCTRPNIVHVVGTLSKFTSKPGKNALERVMQFIWHQNYGLFYKKKKIIIITCSTWRFRWCWLEHYVKWYVYISWWCFYWKSKKQTIIVNSTMNVKIIALTSATQEAEWLREFLYEIPLWAKLISPIVIYCDNTPLMGMVKTC